MEIPDVPIDVAARDPQLCSLMEQRLKLWLHAGMCLSCKQSQSTRIDSDGLKRPCNTPECNFMVGLYEHMRSFHPEAQDNCTLCGPMRRLLHHWRNCGNYSCPICGPTLARLTKPLTQFGSAPAKEWHRHQSLTEDQRQHAVKLLVQFMNCKHHYTYLMQRMVRIEARRYFAADSLAEYYHLLADKMWNMEMEKTNRNVEIIEIHRYNRP